MRRLSEIYRALRERYYFAVDRWRWADATVPLRSTGAGDKRILISNLQCLYGGCKFEALLAAALRQRGYRPVVLLPAPDRNIEPLHTAVGETDFYYDRDLIGGREIRQAQERAEEMVQETADLEQLVNFTVGKFRVGRNAMSLAIRRLRAGRVNLKDKAHRAAVHDALTTSLCRVEAYRRFVADVAPVRALFAERGYSPSAELFDACLEQNVDAVQWCSAPLDNRLLFKRYRLSNRGDHPLTLSSASWERIRQENWSELDEQRWRDYHGSIYSGGGLYNRQQLQEGKLIVDRGAMEQALGLDSAKKTAVIFCHILYDATFFYGESIYPDYMTWLVETVRAAIANPQLNWIVKVHPVNLWRSRMDGLPMEQLEVMALRDAFGDLPPHVKIMTADTPINTYSLFGSIDYGLTVRGTIGMELPCYGIPVVTAGTGRYSGRGFTIDPTDRAEYCSILGSLQDYPRLLPEVAAAAQRYALATLYRRSWIMRGAVIDFDRNDAPIRGLRIDARITETDPAQLLGSKCLGGIAAWIDGSDEDYLVDASDAGFDGTTAGKI
jgi:hypothetical protein